MSLGSRFGFVNSRIRRDAEGLGQQLNPEKCDFYPTCRLVEVVYESRTLHFVRCGFLLALNLYSVTDKYSQDYASGRTAP